LTKSCFVTIALALSGKQGQSPLSKNQVSRQNVFDDMSMYIGQAAFDAVVVEAQAFVVEAEQVEQRGVEVVDCRHVFDGFVAEFVGGSVAESALYACSGEPDGEAGGVVVAAACAFLERGHATEFSDERDERVGEQAA